MPSLTSLSNLKTHLDISDNSEDTLLTQLLDEVEEVVYGWTGRDSFSSSQATEYYDGTGRELLVLERRPVTAIANLYVDGDGYYGHGTDAFPASSEWEEGEDFAPKRTDETEKNAGLVVALKGNWPKGKGNIKVVYTAGYTTIPKDLELAVHNLAAAVRNGAEDGAIKGGETFGKYSYRLLSGEADGGLSVVTARSILGRYTEAA